MNRRAVPYFKINGYKNKPKKYFFEKKIKTNKNFYFDHYFSDSYILTLKKYFFFRRKNLSVL